MPSESALRDGNRPDFLLIETLGYHPGHGAVRAEFHLGRMEHSAREFAFSFDPSRFRQAVDPLVQGDQALRLRVTLAADGEILATATPFEPLPMGTVWRVAVATTRIDRNDPMRLHKTTLRSVYEQARAEFPASEVDEVILLNGDGEVCEGTITNVFADFGEDVLLTPPLMSGVLPGCLRQHLIFQHRAVPALIQPDDLRAAKKLYVGNSLRGLIEARLVN